MFQHDPLVVLGRRSVSPTVSIDTSGAMSSSTDGSRSPDGSGSADFSKWTSCGPTTGVRCARPKTFCVLDADDGALPAMSYARMFLLAFLVL